MATTITIEAIRKLSHAERIALIARIWDTLAEEDADIPVSDEALSEARRRVQELKDDPSKGMSLEETKAWLRTRSGK